MPGLNGGGEKLGKPAKLNAGYEGEAEKEGEVEGEESEGAGFNPAFTTFLPFAFEEEGDDEEGKPLPKSKTLSSDFVSLSSPHE